MKLELKEKILQLTSYEFEQLIGIFFDSMGYEEVEVTSPTRDGGIDAIANVRFGVNEIKVVIQSKRYTTNKIDEKTVRELRGVIPEHKAVQGVIVTTSDFTSGARESAGKVQPLIALITGDMLVEL